MIVIKIESDAKSHPDSFVALAKDHDQVGQRAIRALAAARLRPAKIFYYTPEEENDYVDSYDGRVYDQVDRVYYNIYTEETDHLEDLIISGVFNLHIFTLEDQILDRPHTVIITVTADLSTRDHTFPTLSSAIMFAYQYKGTAEERGEILTIKDQHGHIVKEQNA